MTGASKKSSSVSSLPVSSENNHVTMKSSVQSQDQHKKSTSPVPQNSASASVGVSPLVIGKSFIKQYYQVLSTNPSQISKFYKSNSILSHSLQPSVPTEPQILSSDVFFEWAHAPGNEEDKLCFDFGKGAIDAQETIQGGILLVVTGQVKLPTSYFKPFVHTFFLNNGAAPGKKSRFYVHNDILRFLSTNKDVMDQNDVIFDKKESSSPIASPPLQNMISNDTKDKEEGKTDVPRNSGRRDLNEIRDDSKTTPAPQDQPNSSSPSNIIPESDEVTKFGKSEEPRKESKKDSKNDRGKRAKSREKQNRIEKKNNVVNTLSVPHTSVTSLPTSKEEKKSRKNKSRGRSRKSRSSSPTEKNDKKGKSRSKMPGSWASLVAGGSGSSPKLSAVAAAAADAAKQITEEETNGKESNDVSNVVASNDNGRKCVAKTDVTNNSFSGEKAPSKNPPTNSQTQSAKEKTVQRTPEATILIKNVHDRTKEQDIRDIFEVYACKTNTKILGITLLASRGFCFVDFDSKKAVDEVMNDVTKEKKDGTTDSKFFVHGKRLDVGRKIPLDHKGGRGRGYRSSSPGNGAHKHRGGRRSSPRGGRAGKKG